MRENRQATRAADVLHHLMSVDGFVVNPGSRCRVEQDTCHHTCQQWLRIRYLIGTCTKFSNMSSVDCICVKPQLHHVANLGVAIKEVN